MIYIFMLFVTALMFYPSKFNYTIFGQRRDLYTIFIIPTFIIVVLFIGLRYEVGQDYFMYSNIFYLGYGEQREKGYWLINQFVRNLGFEFEIILVLMAFLSMYFVFRIIKKQEKAHRIMSFLIFWMDGGITYLFNVVRQGLTNFVYLDILDLFRRKKVLGVILLIAFSLLFHYSIIFALIFMLFSNKRFTMKNLIVWYFTAIFIGVFLDTQTIFIKLLNYIPYFGEIYSQSRLIDLYAKRVEFGLGYLFRFILAFIAILKYNEICKNEKILPYLNAYIFWAILKILTLKVWIFERPLDYLRFSSILLIPSLIDSFSDKKIKNIVKIIILGGYFLLFIKGTVFSISESKLIPYKWIFH